MSTAKKCWIGFDLGGTKMFATVLDQEFKILGKRRKRTKGNEGMKAGLERIVKTIEEALEKAGLGNGDIAGIGIGCPGPLDLDKGILLDAPNLGWKDVPLKKVLEKHFDCPAFIVNDVDSGIYGEYRFGAAQGARCAVGVFPGTGIGGGCVYEGRLLRGKTGSVFEVGHMKAVENGPLCGCGRSGCLEAVASRLAISAAAVAAAYRGDAPNLLADIGTDVAEVRSGTLARAISAGDVAIEKIVRKAARLTGSVIGDVANLVLPDVIVLGGGLVEALPEFYLDEVAAAARKRAMPVFAEQLVVREAVLGDNAAVLGAAAWAQMNVDADDNLRE